MGVEIVWRAGKGLVGRDERFIEADGLLFD